MAEFTERNTSSSELINYQLKEIKTDVKEIKETLRVSDERYVLRREHNELREIVNEKVDKDAIKNLRNLGWTVLGATIIAIISQILNFVSKIKP